MLVPTEQKEKGDVNMKLWKDGLSVNDFGSHSDGTSQQFQNSIKTRKYLQNYRDNF